MLAAPLVVLALLLGLRRHELADLRWEDITLAGDGSIQLRSERTKTLRGRRVDLARRPAARRLLAALALRAGRPTTGLVFPTVATTTTARKTPNRDRLRTVQDRLIEDFGAPAFCWQRCRATCASYLASAPGFGLTPNVAAYEMGHDPEVLRKHYFKSVHRISKRATTVEVAMRLGPLVEEIVAMVGARGHDAERSHRQKRSSASR